MNILNIIILPKATYRFSATPINIQMTFFTEIETTTSKFEWNHKRPQITKAVLRKKNKVGGIMFPGSKLTLQSYGNHKKYAIHVKTDTWNRIKNKEINSCRQLIYHKGAKNKEWGNDGLFNKWCYENWTVTYKKKRNWTPSYTAHKGHLKMNIKCELSPVTIKLPEENPGGKFLENALHNDLFFNFLEKQK